MEAGGIDERLSDIAQGILDDGMIYEQPWHTFRLGHLKACRQRGRGSGAGRVGP